MEKVFFLRSLLGFAKVQPFGAPDFKDEDVIRFWYDSLGQLDPNIFMGTMKKLVSKSKFPCVEDVLKACGRGEFNEEELARDACQRIRNAVSKFGYTNWDGAQEYIGAVGVHLVTMMGGWEAVCSVETYRELDFALSQAREYAKVAIKKEKFGELESAIPFSGRLTDHNPPNLTSLVIKK